MLKLAGVPFGWRALRYGKPAKGEMVLTAAGVMSWSLDDDQTSSWQLVVEKEKDYRNIRSFANAAEFIDEMDSTNWLINVETGALETVLLVDDDGIETVRGVISWVDLISRYEFADGRVCGYENQ